MTDVRRALLHPLRLLRRDRGSISVWAVSGAFAMILLVGLAVDLGGQVYAMQNARDVARQAARAGGQQVYGPAAVRGDELRADPVAAQNAARAHISRAGMTGTVSVIDGTRIRVTTRDTYETTFLSIIGISSLSVSGEAESRITRSVDGVER